MPPCPATPCHPTPIYALLLPRSTKYGVPNGLPTRAPGSYTTSSYQRSQPDTRTPTHFPPADGAHWRKGCSFGCAFWGQVIKREKRKARQKGRITSTRGSVAPNDSSRFLGSARGSRTCQPNSKPPPSATRSLVGRMADVSFCSAAHPSAIAQYLEVGGRRGTQPSHRSGSPLLLPTQPCCCPQCDRTGPTPSCICTCACACTFPVSPCLPP